MGRSPRQRAPLGRQRNCCYNLFAPHEDALRTVPATSTVIALNACSVDGEAPIWRASWNVLMAGRLRICVRS